MDQTAQGASSGAKDIIDVLAASGKLTADQVARARVAIASSDKNQIQVAKELGCH